MAQKIVLGAVFGRLTVTAVHPTKTKTGNSKYVCTCACGRTHVASGGALNSGHVRSCGCLRTTVPKPHPSIKGMAVLKTLPLPPETEVPPWVDRETKNMANRFRRLYRISTEMALSLAYKTMTGVCDVCTGHNSEGKRLFVDHCHLTGTVRGALCTDCNMALGAIEKRGLQNKAGVFTAYLKRAITLR